MSAEPAADREDPIEVFGPEETEAIGRRIAAELEPGDVVLLRGEVGAGKSTLIRAALRELGVEGAIPSPTFTIGRSYEGRLPVSHLDLHRLGPVADEDPGLLAEYFAPERVVFVEWPGEDVGVLATGVARVRTIELTHLGGDSRRIAVGPIRRVT